MRLSLLLLVFLIFQVQPLLIEKIIAANKVTPHPSTVKPKKILKEKNKYLKEINKKDSETKIKTILILGDSLTEGYGVPKNKAFPKILEKSLNKYLQNSTIKKNSIIQSKNIKKNTNIQNAPKVLKDGAQIQVRVINAGSSGSTSASAVSRLRWHLKTSKPNVLILALGANDGLRGIEPRSTQKNLDKTIRMSKKNKIKVILAGMVLPYNYGEKYRKKFSATFISLVKIHRISYIPFLLKDVGGKKEYNIDDGIHPNEAGHKIIAKNLFKTTLELIK